jgi:exopolysaccharide biosynthesis protein
MTALISRLCHILMLSTLIPTLTTSEPSPVVIPIPSHRSSFANFSEIPYNRKRRAYWLTTTHNVSIAVATVDGSQKLQTTGLTALQFGCDVAATNAGPFNLDGSNSGPAVIKGRHVQTETPTDYVGFGTTIDGKYIFGNYQQFSSENIWEFVTGFGWLVYNGSVVVGPGEDEKKAPRTIVGLDNDSNLISVVIDGCERW